MQEAISRHYDPGHLVTGHFVEGDPSVGFLLRSTTFQGKNNSYRWSGHDYGSFICIQNSRSQHERSNLCGSFILSVTGGGSRLGIIILFPWSKCPGPSQSQVSKQFLSNAL